MRRTSLQAESRATRSASLPNPPSQQETPPMAKGRQPSFVSRIRDVVAEYLQKGLGPSAAMEEIKAALREHDRGQNDSKGQ